MAERTGKTRFRTARIPAIVVSFLWLLGACGGDPCLDDGFVWGQGGKACAQVTDSNTGSASSTNTTSTGDMAGCDNGVQDGDETDVDCGGSCGSTCQGGDHCLVSADCTSQFCENDACVPNPSCSDGVQNGDETDLDCGGNCGPTCEDGEGCNLDSDCVDDYCQLATQTCRIPTCMDGVQNGDETDIDCGGSCGPSCDEGEHCKQDPDCVDDYCNPLEICADPACTPLGDDNGCQGCIKTNCCDAVAECMLDPGCNCWLQCIQHNNDFDVCVQTCMISGKPGKITACANSKCNLIGACAKP